jgi:hypothetical protein
VILADTYPHVPFHPTVGDISVKRQVITGKIRNTFCMHFLFDFECTCVRTYYECMCYCAVHTFIWREGRCASPPFSSASFSFRYGHYARNSMKNVSLPWSSDYSVLLTKLIKVQLQCKPLSLSVCMCTPMHSSSHEQILHMPQFLEKRQTCISFVLMLAKEEKKDVIPCRLVVEYFMCIKVVLKCIKVSFRKRNLSCLVSIFDTR